MKITFLGTGSGAPSRHRNVSAIALQLPQQSHLWLFDCGEGTQHQIMRSAVRLSQIQRIFITHMHGDHLFGLPGLLASRSLQAGSETPVTIYGPVGLSEYIRKTMELTQARPNYEVIVETVSPGLVCEDEKTQVFCTPVRHRIPAFAYAVVERDQPGRFEVERAKELGIEPGPIYARLKAGEMVALEDGRVIDGKALTGPTREGRRFVYSGDTGYCRSLVELAEAADVLVHEATYMEEERHLADRAAHSTSVIAANVAREARVRQLILTHLSPRYEGEAGNRIGELLAEAQAIFPNTTLAKDFAVYDLARREAEHEHSYTAMPPSTQIPLPVRNVASSEAR